MRLHSRLGVAAVQIEECNVSTALDVIGGKWKPLILWVLKQGRIGQ
jgi:DNA-binding HxlR family transcriptional regulator